MEEVFSPILDDDEKVLKIIKPKKSALYFKNFIIIALWTLFIFGSMCFGVALSMLEDAEVIEENAQGLMIFSTIGIFLVILIGILLVTWLLLHIYYKNVYYAYTNKRILIRKGIFGVDYKSLDIKMIGASTVNVSLLDKILRKNTGTLNFGSMASPINGTASINNFVLANVVDPYGLYKEIKNHISNVTENKVNTKDNKEKEDKEK